MIIGMVLFGVAIFFGSWFIAGRQRKMDRSELAFYLVLIAWGSLLVGMSLFLHRAS